MSYTFYQNTGGSYRFIIDNVLGLGCVGFRRLNMSVGKVARQILGEKFKTIGRLYRSLFVNLRQVSISISPYIPNNSLVLDIGGGDGEPLNYLLSLREDIKVIIIDPNKSIGGFIDEVFASRVQLLPGVRIDDYSAFTYQVPDVILISDVIHHIPSNSRSVFFTELKKLIVNRKKNIQLIIKDIEPGSFRSHLSKFSDRFISGDKSVSLIKCSDLKTILFDLFKNSITINDTDLFELDRPNYAIVVTYKQ